MKLRLPTALLLLTLLLIPAALAAGSSSDNPSRLAKLVAKIRKIGKSSPKPDIFEDVFKDVLPAEEYKKLKPYWNHVVQNGWVEPESGLPVRVDAYRSEDELRYVDYVTETLGKYAHLVKV